MWCIEAQLKLHKEEKQCVSASVFGGKISFSLTFKAAGLTLTLSAGT